MSFKEKRELEELPGKIESLEAESEALLAAMSRPDYHKRSVQEQKADKERSVALPALIESMYRRWEELSDKQALEGERL
jgi:ATP-binding cassette subfamily F protein uup